MCEQLQPSYLPTQLQMHLQSLLVFKKDKLETVHHFLTLWNIWRHWLTSSLRMWHVLQSSHLTAHSTCLAMKPLTYATEKRSMSTSFTSHCTCSAIWEPLRPSWRVSLLWLVDGFGQEALDSLSKECRLSRSSVSSPSQFALSKLVYARPLMILVFRTSTNCPTFGLLFELQCKRLTPNVFSRGSWFRFGS